MSFFKANWNANKLGDEFENIRFYIVANSENRIQRFTVNSFERFTVNSFDKVSLKKEEISI